MWAVGTHATSEDSLAGEGAWVLKWKNSVSLNRKSSFLKRTRFGVFFATYRLCDVGVLEPLAERAKNLILISGSLALQQE